MKQINYNYICYDKSQVKNVKYICIVPSCMLYCLRQKILLHVYVFVWNISTLFFQVRVFTSNTKNAKYIP